MKNIILLLLISSFALKSNATTKIDISSKLMAVYENTTIDGLDENLNEGVIFITESLHIENGSRIQIRNACLVILGDISGKGILDIDASATVTLQGDRMGNITFTNQFLADDTCLQTTGDKTFKHIREVPLGISYSLYTLSGKLLIRSEVDEYIHNYLDPKTYLIKIEGYKTRKIVFE
ncbi:hypothetical protein NBT05_13905 [Aquimarina sp. ERC-38]|uniref:hypothetical protein n=1 Tax=Aquimarina sp. ERC-38 TaxID=2949996 RepID=UPI002248256A|nr:hypothetical protein [Aquimarina sp. ERC-38]UZO80037.1 hypothetical protein NBT05_13905 [Aquimarina sp. ERC-38]